MARITRFHDDGSISVTDFAEPNYQTKRGKVTPAPRPNWGTPTDGDRKPLDTGAASKVLDEALGD
jgi:hypothetical protein